MQTIADRKSGGIDEIVASLIDDTGYRAAFIKSLEARHVEPAIVERLIAYARGRQATRGQAIARKILTEAGVSWEAL